MKKRIIISIVSIFIIAATATGVLLVNQHNDTTKTVKKTTTTKIANTITYRGTEGSTALEILQRVAKVETSGTGENAFVTTINGVTANPKTQYWSFEVNGKPATVGAGNYMTRRSDLIVWKLSSF